MQIVIVLTSFWIERCNEEFISSQVTRLEYDAGIFMVEVTKTEIKVRMIFDHICEMKCIPVN